MVSFSSSDLPPGAVRIADVREPDAVEIGRVHDRNNRLVREFFEQLQRPPTGFIEPGFVAGDVAHAGCGVQHDDHRDRLLPADVEALAFEGRLIQREAEERDDKHPHREKNEVSQAELALVGFELLLEEPERREREPLRLLLHDEVQQDRQPNERRPGNQDRVHSDIVNARGGMSVSGSLADSVPLLTVPRTVERGQRSRRRTCRNRFADQPPAIENAEMKPEDQWVRIQQEAGCWRSWATTGTAGRR